MAVSMELIKELRAKTGAGVLDCKKALTETNGDVEAAVDFLRKKGLARAAKKSGRSTTEGVVVTKKSENELFMLAVMCETDFVARTDEYKTMAANLADTFYAELGETQKAVAVSEELVEKNREAVNEVVAKMGENIQVGDYTKFTGSENSHLYDYIHFTGKIGVAVEVVCEKDDEKLAELGKNICLHAAAYAPDFVSGDEISEDILEKERVIYRDQMRESGKPEKIIENIVEGKIRKFKEERCLLSQNFALDESKTVQQLIDECAKAIDCPVTVKRFARVYIGE
jgi:elongation factor Ts